MRSSMSESVAGCLSGVLGIARAAFRRSPSTGGPSARSRGPAQRSSHRHRCIYVKVPKCASTSVLEWFAAHGGGYPSFRPPWHGGPMSRRLPGTAHAMNLYPDYFTFTFLRNPYERFVSLWLHLRRVARARRGGGGGPGDAARIRRARRGAGGGLRAVLGALLLAGCGTGDDTASDMANPVAGAIRAASGADAIRAGAPPFAVTIGTPAAAFTSSTQSVVGPRYALAIPWFDDDGDIQLTMSIFSRRTQEQRGRVALEGFLLDTTFDAVDLFAEGRLEPFGSEWRWLTATQGYDGAGRLTVSVATDATADLGHVQPWVGYGAYDRDIQLPDIAPLQANQDWHAVAVGTGLPGTLDGVPGTFTVGDADTCPPVIGCFMEVNRNAAAPGYFPRGDALFTPDDPNLPAEPLPERTGVPRLPPLDHLVFGYWTYVPGDPASVADYDFGVFGGGDDPYSSPVGDLAGTATYSGGASGLAFKGTATTSFTADIALTANFDSGEVAGPRRRIPVLRRHRGSAGRAGTRDRSDPDEPPGAVRLRRHRVGRHGGVLLGRCLARRLLRQRREPDRPSDRDRGHVRCRDRRRGRDGFLRGAQGVDASPHPRNRSTRRSPSTSR